MTEQKFVERLKELKRDIRFNKLTTALARLYADNKIKSIGFGCARIISRQYNPYIALIRESIEIFTRQYEGCNDNLSFNIPKIWFNLLKNT